VKRNATQRSSNQAMISHTRIDGDGDDDDDGYGGEASVCASVPHATFVSNRLSNCFWHRDEEQVVESGVLTGSRRTRNYWSARQNLLL
jgi:hypothetical protein